MLNRVNAAANKGLHEIAFSLLILCLPTSVWGGGFFFIFTDFYFLLYFIVQYKHFNIKLQKNVCMKLPHSSYCVYTLPPIVGRGNTCLRHIA